MKHVALLLFFFVFSSVTLAQEWNTISDKNELKALFQDTQQRAQLANGKEAIANYNSDGTGELQAWGETFERRWKVEDGKVKIWISGVWISFTIERNTKNENTYRGTRENGEQVVFEVSDKEISVKEVDTSSESQGGSGKPSADEVAKALANPNAPLAKLTTFIQYRTFKGSLADANNQSSTTLLLQPSFPFPLENGDVVLFRPAIPVVFGQPVFDANQNMFDGKTGLGDISFDLAYGRTNKKTGLLTAIGMVATLPTATSNGIGGKNFNLGPEVLVGLITPNYVIGAFPNHQWKIAGNGAATSITSAQVFANFLPGNAWSVGTTPIMNYDWNNEQWNIPLNVTVGKTYILGGRPWSFSLQVNYFVESADAFGQDWFIGLSAGPVVENVLARLFK